jgi:hypothetical protein
LPGTNTLAYWAQLYVAKMKCSKYDSILNAAATLVKIEHFKVDLAMTVEAIYKPRNTDKWGRISTAHLLIKIESFF